MLKIKPLSAAILAGTLLFTTVSVKASTLLASDADLPSNNLGTISATIPSSVVVSSAQGVAYTPSGQIIVSHYSGALDEYSATGVFQATLANLGSGNGGVAVDASGNIYLSHGAAILKFSSTGVSLGNFVSEAAPQGLAFDQAGHLYAADMSIGSGGSVLEYSSGGSLLQTFTGGLNGAFGVAVNSANDVLVGNFNGTTVSEFAPNGTSLGNFVSGLSNAAGLAIDGSGNVFVCVRNSSQVNEYTSAGTFVSSYSTGSSQPTYIAAPAPVPEPASFMMMAAGAMSFIGLRRWRKRGH